MKIELEQLYDADNNTENIVDELQSADTTTKESFFSSRVITITSGKGGVGKTNLAVNLAIQLRKHGKRVVVIDADLGLANVEVLFGITPAYSFADVLLGNANIYQVLTQGPMGIQFISGGSGLIELANATNEQMQFILQNLTLLDSISDIIIIDTGAGISNSVVSFIKASKEAIIITTPEPTSMTDAYSIIKAVKESADIIPQLKLVVNRVDDEKEGEEIFRKLNQVSERFLDIKLQNLGSIPYDNNLVKAVKKQEPVSICFPFSQFTRATEDIALNILDISKSAPQEGILSFFKNLVNIFAN